MPATTPLWDLPLESPPVVLRAGAAVHGQTAIERWQVTFWSLHAYRYHARLVVNGHSLTIEPRTVSVLPPGEMEYRFSGPSPHVFVHLRPAPAAGVLKPRVPAIVRLGPAFDQFERRLRQTVVWQAREPARARACVWDLLWTLTEMPTPADQSPAPGRHPALDKALEWFELNLAEPVSIDALAEAADVSHVHLIRLFRRHLGTTPLAHLRRRRAERAEYLLQHTSLPMKTVARQIGLADAQQLNKLIRALLGRPPSAVRARHLAAYHANAVRTQ